MSVCVGMMSILEINYVNVYASCTTVSYSYIHKVLMMSIATTPYFLAQVLTHKLAGASVASCPFAI